MVMVDTAPEIQTASYQDGARVPALTRDEAMTMSAEELRRFLALVESLDEDDWERETACTLWTVKDIVAHQAAHVSSFTSLGAFVRQLNPVDLHPYRQKGMNLLDSWNQAQVDARREYSPSALIAEIRSNAAASLAGHARLPAFARDIPLPLPGLDQPRSPSYVFDLIYTRDMWMHRADMG